MSTCALLLLCHPNRWSICFLSAAWNRLTHTSDTQEEGGRVRGGWGGEVGGLGERDSWSGVSPSLLSLVLPSRPSHLQTDSQHTLWTSLGEVTSALGGSEAWCWALNSGTFPPSRTVSTPACVDSIDVESWLCRCCVDVEGWLCRCCVDIEGWLCRCCVDVDGWLCRDKNLKRWCSSTQHPPLSPPVRNSQGCSRTFLNLVSFQHPHLPNVSLSDVLTHKHTHTNTPHIYHKHTPHIYHKHTHIKTHPLVTNTHTPTHHTYTTNTHFIMQFI